MIPTNLDQRTMMMANLDQTMSNLVGHMKAVKISGQHPHVVHKNILAATSLRMKTTAIHAKLKASNNHPRVPEKWSMENALVQQGGVFRGFENPKTNAGCPEITLRKLRLSDVDDVVGWYRDTRVIQFVGQSVTNQNDGLQYIRMGKTAPWTRAICYGSRAIGEIFVEPDDDEDCRGAEIRYLVCPEWRGRGVATKAVKMAVAAAFKKWPKLEWVEATVHKDNKWSRRVLKKAGFKWHSPTWYRLFRP